MPVMLPFFGAAPVKHCERPVFGLAPYEEAVQTPEKHEPSTVGANPTTQDTTAQDLHFKARTETQDYWQPTKGLLRSLHDRSLGRHPSCVALGTCAW